MRGTRNRALSAADVIELRCLVGIEAPALFGKSELLAEIVRQWKGPVVSGLALYDASPCPDQLVVLDDPDASLAELARECSEKFALTVVAARVLPRSYFGFTQSSQRIFAASDLVLTKRDIQHCLRAYDLDDAELAQVIVDRGGGWPAFSLALVQIAVRSTDPIRDVVSALNSPALIGSLVETFNSLSTDQFSLLVQLSHFPTCTSRCFEALDPGGTLLEKVRQAGFAIEVRSDSVVLFHAQLRRWLQSLKPLDRRQAQRAFPALVGGGDYLSAAHLMIAANDADKAASLIGSLSAAALEQFSATEVLSLIEALLGLVGPTPALLLAKARVLISLGRVVDANDSFSTALTSVGVAADSSLYAEIESEMLAEQAFQGVDLHDRLELLLRKIPLNWIIARSNIAIGLGAVVGRDRNNPAELKAVEDLLLSSVTALEAIGEPLRAARTLRVLASTIMSAQYRFTEIQAVLGRCDELARGLSRQETSNAVFSCLNAAVWGNVIAFDEQSKRADTLLNSSAPLWQHAYANIAKMIAAGWRNDRVGTQRFASLARDQLGQLLRLPTGATFRASAAQSFARANDKESAFVELEMAVTLGAHQTEVKIAQVVVASRVGDASEGVRLGDLLLEDECTPRPLRWRVLVEQALSYHRLGDYGAAAQTLANAEKDAELFGDKLFQHMIPASLQNLSGKGTVSDNVRITVLGEFTVRRAAKCLEVPAGRISTLLKLLAVRAAVPTDVAIDLLWPKADPETGKRRLKNVVMRTRKLIGSDVIWRSQSTIGLEPGVRSDYLEFDAIAQRAIVLSVSRDRSAIEKCLEALELARGPLLPVDLYDDWIEVARRGVVARALALVDELGKAELSHQLAARMLESVLRIEPDGVSAFTSTAKRAKNEGNDVVLEIAISLATKNAEVLGEKIPRAISALMS